MSMAAIVSNQEPAPRAGSVIERGAYRVYKDVFGAFKSMAGRLEEVVNDEARGIKIFMNVKAYQVLIAKGENAALFSANTEDSFFEVLGSGLAKYYIQLRQS